MHYLGRKIKNLMNFDMKEIWVTFLEILGAEDKAYESCVFGGQYAINHTTILNFWLQSQ